MPGAANEEAQRGFKLVDGADPPAAGDKRATDAMPAPKDDERHRRHLRARGHPAERRQRRGRRGALQADRRSKRLTLNPLKPIAALYYGRALAKLGKAEESRKAYDRFFESWKNADANLPLLVEAKKEYARFKTDNQTTMPVTKLSDQSPR